MTYLIFITAWQALTAAITSPAALIIWQGIALNIGCGPIATILSLFLVLLFFKPSLRLSPFLCKDSDEVGDYYVMKFVNDSFFTAYDVKAELFEVSHFPAEEGNTNKAKRSLHLWESGSITEVVSRPLFWQPKTTDNCIRLRTNAPIEQILSDKQKTIELKITARHGLTALGTVSSKEYVGRGTIRQGEFTSGMKFGYV